MASNTPFTRRPYHLDLDYRGHIIGSTHLDPATNTPLCHLVTALPYALPPIGPYRWQRPRPLPPCYRYGHSGNPGRFDGANARCPQPGYLTPPKTDLWDEDCLQSNIWIPADAAAKPRAGWPVLVYLHGGQLQFGHPGMMDFTRALAPDAPLNAIIVVPGYRLNVFGFLGARELAAESPDGAVGNYGLWDCKAALDWTWKNISYFGGDAANISLAGHSAGAYAAFHLLAHYLLLDPDVRARRHAIPFRRVAMLSNGPGVQPKRPAQLDRQFQVLRRGLASPFQSGAELLAELRGLSARALVDANDRMPQLHEFRACSDGVFVSTELFATIDDGRFARELAAHGVALLLGEVRDEHSVYALWRPPREASWAALRTRLCADYDARAVDAALGLLCPDRERPAFRGRPCASWQEVFGHVYAAMQVHGLQRGFADALARHGAAELVRRYRIEWIAGAAEAVRPGMGVAHGSDLDSVWFQGQKARLTEEERRVTRGWVQALDDFVGGQRNLVGNEWGNKVVNVRVLKPDGSTKVEVDGEWHRGVELWQAVRRAQSTDAKTARL